MLIAHISDAHLGEKGNTAVGISRMADNLAATVLHINEMTPQPDVVLLTGDVTDAGLPQAVEHAVEILVRLKAPLFVVPGNHDTPQALSKGFGLCVDYVIDDFPIRLIGMDSTIPDMSGGELTPNQLAWLEDTLAAEPARPTIIFLHHPPVKCSVLETDEDGFIGADALGGIVQKHDNIERILCGHIHLPIHANWHNTVVSTAPSLGMQLSLDLTMQQPSAFFLSPPAYLLHHWTTQKTLISHMVTVQALDGPHGFDA